MPLIEVWNSVRVHADMESRERSMLRAALREACLSIPELGLTKQEQVTVRYPDLADERSNSGDPIVIVVELLFDKFECTLDVRRKLATLLGLTVREFLIWQDRRVEIAVKRFDPNHDAFFSVE